jgi:hypothetical protein
LCLCIHEVRHAKAVNTNFRNQIKIGNFEIGSNKIGEDIYAIQSKTLDIYVF